MITIIQTISILTIINYDYYKYYFYECNTSFTINTVFAILISDYCNFSFFLNMFIIILLFLSFLYTYNIYEQHINHI